MGNTDRTHFLIHTTRQIHFFGTGQAEKVAEIYGSERKIRYLNSKGLRKPIGTHMQQTNKQTNKLDLLLQSDGACVAIGTVNRDMNRVVNSGKPTIARLEGDQVMVHYMMRYINHISCSWFNLLEHKWNDCISEWKKA